MNRKLLIKYIKVAVLTVVLFLAGLYLVDRLVTPEGTAEAFYDEPNNSIDVLIVGGSQTMCTISPTKIYEETGLTAYNFSTWSQPVWVSYYYIQEALKTQQPKVVILDVFGSFYDRSYLTGVDVDLVSDDYAQLLKPSWNLVQLNWTRRRVQVTRKFWYEYINIAKYHTRISSLTTDSFAKLLRDDSTTAKGYGPFYGIEDFSGYVYPESEETIDIYPYAQEYLLQIIDLCRKNDIKLMFVKMPHIADENDIAVLNSIWQLAEEHDIDYLDFCSQNTLDLDFAMDFSDHGHLNNYGAKKATAAVAAYLSGLSLSPVHRDAIEARWQSASAFEDNEASEMEIRLSQSFAQMMERTVLHEKTAVLLVKYDDGTLNSEDTQAMQLLLEGTPFDAVKAQVAENDLFVYADGEVLTGPAAEAWCTQNGITVRSGDCADILYEGENHSYQRVGLNVALFNTETKEMYHYISFAKEHGYLPYTR